MKKIIHLSDLHVGYRDFKERFLALVDNLIFEKGDKASEYIIVITGDLVNNASKKESFEDVKEGLDVLKEAGFKHILVIPGNHDYGSGTKGSKKYVRVFKDNFFKKDIEYPKIDIIDNVAFLGLDSMAAELNWYDRMFSEGELGKKQLNKLAIDLNLKEVRACKKRVIYLHHHPFKWRPFHQLKDSKRLKNVLTQAIKNGISIDAILFGHNHEGKAHNGHWGIPRCYDAGTATLKPRPKIVGWAKWYRIRSSTRVIDLSRDPHFDYVLQLI